MNWTIVSKNTSKHRNVEFQDDLVSYIRHIEKKAVVMMLDFSYSMQSNIILAAITAAAIAQHFKKDYGILAFNSGVCILKEVDESTGPEKILKGCLRSQSCGDTNIHASYRPACNMWISSSARPACC